MAFASLFGCGGLRVAKSLHNEYFRAPRAAENAAGALLPALTLVSKAPDNITQKE